MPQSSAFTARTEFASALAQICSERGLETDVVLRTIESAILAAYRKDYGLEEGFLYKVLINPDDGGAKIFKYPKLNEEIKIFEEAKAGVDYDQNKGDEVTPPGFGRIASQTAKQVILQKIREAEKDAIVNEYQARIGTLVSGMVLRRDGKFVVVDIGRGQAILPPEDQIPGEKYSLNKRLTFYISDIRDTMKGKQIIVSRTAAELVGELFRREVPEVSSGAVEIKKIAREAGGRTKIAVISTQSGVDPVGSCVGQKGVRVQTVIDELNGEKIDIIQYSEDIKRFITAALSPAENLQIDINQKEKATVVTVPEDQLSLAIGRDGQNVRLAAKLTGFKIDIKGPGGSLTISEKKKLGIVDEEKKSEEEKSESEKKEKKEKKVKKKKANAGVTDDKSDKTIKEKMDEAEKND